MMIRSFSLALIAGLMTYASSAEFSEFRVQLLP